MVSPSDHRSPAAATLPQYGFGTDVDFGSLVKDNHFLFRVYTPKEPSPFADDSEPSFVAPKFNERYTRSPAEIKVPPFDSDNYSRPHTGTYADVAKHMDWTTRSSSPYISTSFSFIWSIWEALRRYHVGIKKDVEIAVIDASALSGRAVTAVQLLRNSLPTERRSEHWKWYRFAQESQSVLVHECIPAAAVFASIPLISLLEKLPSYFLRQSLSESIKGSTLAMVGWDYAEKKRNYRQFCQEMSTRFLQSTPEARLHDTSAGSVCLALSFLRPWFHRCVAENFDRATATLCTLSFSIAQWPGQWWAQEHAELWNLIRAMVLAIAEEVRNTQGECALKEVKQVQEEMLGPEEAVETYKSEVAARDKRKHAHLLSPLLIPPPLRPAVMPISPSPFALAPPSGISMSGPHTVITPITPPTSPIRSAVASFSPYQPHVSTQISASATATAPPSPVDSDSTSELSLSNSDESSSLEDSLSSIAPESPRPLVEKILLSERSHPISPPNPTTLPPSPVETESETLALELVSSPSLSIPPSSPKACLALDMMLHFPLFVNEDKSPVHLPESRRKRILRRAPTIAETASCLVTGFLVGAFITLCLFSPHRRSLLVRT
ncbi:hypothetical protein FPV67DRAFT_167362 [Lyophyllum atratum]|nr:hypothetical protein FPV67DRAFT_167362 [Lyophyllum atratum]